MTTNISDFKVGDRVILIDPIIVETGTVAKIQNNCLYVVYDKSPKEALFGLYHWRFKKIEGNANQSSVDTSYSNKNNSGSDYCGGDPDSRSDITKIDGAQESDLTPPPETPKVKRDHSVCKVGQGYVSNEDIWAAVRAFGDGMY